MKTTVRSDLSKVLELQCDMFVQAADLKDDLDAAKQKLAALQVTLASCVPGAASKEGALDSTLCVICLERCDLPTPVCIQF